MDEKNDAKPMDVTNPAYQKALRKRVKELQPEEEESEAPKKETDR